MSGSEIRSAALLIASAFVFGFGGFTLAFAMTFEPSAAVFGLVLIGASVVTSYTSQRIRPSAHPTNPTTSASGGWDPQEGDA